MPSVTAKLAPSAAIKCIYGFVLTILRVLSGCTQCIRYHSSGCFVGTCVMVWLPQCWWSTREGHGQRHPVPNFNEKQQITCNLSLLNYCAVTFNNIYEFCVLLIFYVLLLLKLCYFFFHFWHPGIKINDCITIKGLNLCIILVLYCPCMTQI